jgi:hypothetical protein
MTATAIHHHMAITSLTSKVGRPPLVSGSVQTTFSAGAPEHAGPMTETLGTRPAKAIAAKGEPALRALLADGDDVADTAHVSHRFDLTNPDGWCVAERQAYYRGGPPRRKASVWSICWVRAVLTPHGKVSAGVMRCTA